VTGMTRRSSGAAYSPKSCSGSHGKSPPALFLWALTACLSLAGMNAMVFNAKTEWLWGPFVGTVVVAIVAASAAYWILFRVLEWRPSVESLRVAAALIMVRQLISDSTRAGHHGALISLCPSTLDPARAGHHSCRATHASEGGFARS
jgi:hypothetical protein